MFKLIWNEAFAVNNKVIDGQHKQLLDIFDRAYKMLDKESTSIQLIEIISKLTTYTVFHFHEEEELMRKAGYEKLPEHIAEHEYFISKVKEFQEKISNDNRKLEEEIFLFLAEWLINHIKNTDQQYKGII